MDSHYDVHFDVVHDDNLCDWCYNIGIWVEREREKERKREREKERKREREKERKRKKIITQI